MNRREGRNRKRMVITLITVYMVLGLVLAFLCGDYQYHLNAEAAANYAAAQEQSAAARRHHDAAEAQAERTAHGTSDGYSRYIEGDIYNTTGATINYGEINFTLYDTHKNQVGTAMDNCTNLAAETTWHFKAVVADSDCTTFTLSDLQGWSQ